MNQTLAVVINTRNEEHTIEGCIESARLISEHIYVVDMESTDNTVQIAKKLGVKTTTFPYSRYVEPARNFDVNLAKDYDWVFILDADERITKDSAHEILHVLSKEHAYYKIPRKELFAKKKWLKYGGWWPNHQIRLIHVKDFIEWPNRIHATPEIKGSLGYLHEPLLHYSKNDYGAIVEKTIMFENIEAQLLHEAGRSVSVSIFFRKFFGELYRRLIKNQGFRDGTVGIIESVYQAYSKTITYLYLYEKKKGSSV